MPGASADVAPSAMITGATGGIGRAIAGRLARAGYRLTLSGRDEAALAKVASDLADSDAKLQVVPADMTAEDGVRALAWAGLSADAPVWLSARLRSPPGSGTRR